MASRSRVAHALWDLGHVRGLGSPAPRAYALACIAMDLLVAAALLRADAADVRP